MKTISDMKRYPRTFVDMANFKSSEWPDAVLFYAFPLLIESITTEISELFCQLSSVMYIFFKSKISESDHEYGEKAIDNFVKKFQRRYGMQKMNPILHQLIHIPKVVRQIGPMWGYSTFHFEDENANLLQLVRGPHKVCEQISKRLALQRHYNNTSSLAGLSVEVSNYCERIKRLQTLHFDDMKFIEKTYGDSKFTLFRQDKSVILFSEIESIKNHSNINLQKDTQYESFKKISVNGKVFKSKDISTSKTDDYSFIRLKNGSYAQIECFLMIENEILMLIRVFTRLAHIRSPIHFTVFEQNSRLEVHNVNLVEEKCIGIPISNLVWMAPLPNQTKPTIAS